MSMYLKSLQDDVWRTSSARYHAARRLKRKENFSTISLAFFSALSIALAVIQQTYSTEVSATPGLNNYLTSISILSGIFILIISIMEWGARNGSNADALYKNAQELNALRKEISLEASGANISEGDSWKSSKEYLRRYEEVKNRCDINHSPLDDFYFVSQHRKSPEFAARKIAWHSAYWTSFRWQLSSIWYYLILWSIIFISIMPVVTSINFISTASCGSS
ncbi:TPA: SLATT domain-containing protein [Pseudomonas sp. H2]|uniref:SLATT domain-containing protein n=1 Tax=Pseudomonas sp. H2 TaxID=658612 RepID=UPI00126A0556|nr:SLATT domain-containing protein [Pseudomonas sp. H2]